MTQIITGFEQEDAQALLGLVRKPNLPAPQGLLGTPKPKNPHGLHGTYYTTSTITASSGSGVSITAGSGTAKLVYKDSSHAYQYYLDADDAHIEKTLYSFFPESIASGKHVGVIEDTFGVLTIIAVYCS